MASLSRPHGGSLPGFGPSGPCELHLQIVEIRGGEAAAGLRAAGEDEELEPWSEWPA